MALIKLRDSDLPRDASAKALLDGDLYDRDGEKIGTVKDLYLDTEEGDVRFLDVGVGGFLGFGEKHFMVPMEAVTDRSGGGDDRAESREGGGITRARHQRRARGRLPARGLRLLRLGKKEAIGMAETTDPREEFATELLPTAGKVPRSA